MWFFSIVFTIFALYVLIKIILRFKAGETSARSLIFWLIFWFVAIAVAWFPNSSVPLAHFFGIGRGADFVIYASTALLFFLFFQQMVKTEKLNRDITKLTRKISLLEKKGE